MTDREHDLVLYGATGFTGQLVAEQIAQRAPEGARIALAGRSLAGLGEVRESLGERAAGWPLILAEAGDRPSLNRLAQSTVAVATTVGPYLRYGLPLVGACAKFGTHYVDLSGEVLFMHASVQTSHDLARSTGARIVHACGYDSIPSDLGVLTLHRAIGALSATTLLVGSTKGGVSGGTMASLRVQREAMAADPSAADIVADPYALSPDRTAEPDFGDQAEITSAVHDEELGWLGPFVMASTNTRIVRRSNALAGYPYSHEFRYREAIGFGQGVAARAKATGMGAGMGALALAMGLKPARSGLKLVLPKPGEGPSAEDRAAGHFRMGIHTSDVEGQRWVATVAAQGDPGYGATSVMLAESALLAAFGDPGLPDAAGVLTPATGFGDVLVQRLRDAGFTFDVQRWQPQEEAAEEAGVLESEEADLA